MNLIRFCSYLENLCGYRLFFNTRCKWSVGDLPRSVLLLKDSQLGPEGHSGTISRGRCRNKQNLAEHSSSSSLKSDSSAAKFKRPCMGTFSLKASAGEAFFDCLDFCPLFASSDGKTETDGGGGVRCVSRCVTAHAGYYREPNSKQLIPGGARRQIKQHVIPSRLAPPGRFRRGKGSSQSRG